MADVGRVEEKAGLRAYRAEKTRLSILDAAESEFSRLGLYGARVDDIAKAAGANKRMIYEYFGNKEELYKTVLERVYGRLNACERGIIECAETMDAAEAIGALVRTYFTFLRDNLTYVRMVMWENLNEARYFDEKGMNDIRNPIKRALRAIIDHGVRDGAFRGDLDERQVLMTLFACPYNYFSNVHTMSRIMGSDLASEAEIERRIAFITDMLLGYMTRS